MRRPDKPDDPLIPLLKGGPLAEALMQAIAPLESAPLIRQSLALVCWPRVAGEQAAKASRAEMIRNGVLFVRTRSSTWSQELALHKHKLLQKLARLLGPGVVTDIVFRAQGVDGEDPSFPEEEEPTAEELHKVVLTDEEQELLKARLASLASISNARVRQAIAHRLEMEARLYHWRLERGWKACKKCQVLHKTPYALCPLCRLEES
ncbi:DciA family protein [Chthonomonas calidirosea]|uniref:DciA family protein n=1 Tax=Chthonomonas calidirosea TaxID=454171 RepID=UPI0009E8C4A0|nr:DUF721 domain-containing protein [Chthonomonas calidirosea]